MITGLKCDNQSEVCRVESGVQVGERHNFRVITASTLMEPFRDDNSASVQNNATDLRIGVGGWSVLCQCNGTLHRGRKLGVRYHPASNSSKQVRREICCPTDSAFLSSGLKHFAYHRRYQNCTGSAPQARGSRTFTAGSDSHRPRNTSTTVHNVPDVWETRPTSSVKKGYRQKCVSGG